MGERCCFRCGPFDRTRALSLGPLNPGFETRFAKSGAFAGDQRSLTELRAGISRTRIGDDLTRIIELCQAPADEFIQSKLFRPPDFDGALYRLADCYPAHPN